MRYATFWQRLLALLVDVLVLLPLAIGPMFFEGVSRPLDIVVTTVLTVIGWLYVVFFHARWGQTVGKMALKIRVVRTDGSPIGWGNALRRHSVDGVLSLLSIIAQSAAILSIPGAEYVAAGWTERGELVANAAPAGLQWVNIALMVWGWGEVLTMMFNRRRRALHDFLGGTVVVRLGG
jgi:uncharacterized RDD family membrane protein YckC